MADGTGGYGGARTCQHLSRRTPMGRIVGIIVVVWLVIGVLAAVPARLLRRRP